MKEKCQSRSCSNEVPLVPASASVGREAGLWEKQFCSLACRLAEIEARERKQTRARPERKVKTAFDGFFARLASQVGS